MHKNVFYATALALILTSTCSQAQQAKVTHGEPSAASEADRWFAHVQYLASDGLQGRLIGTPGYDQAVSYVEAQYKQLGLKPAGTQGYQQPVPFDQVELDKEASSFQIQQGDRTTSLQVGSQVILSPQADRETHIDAAAVFVGYGLSIPSRHIDEISKINLRGKIAVVSAGSPAELRGPLRSYFRSAARRWIDLKKAGAVGIIMIADSRPSGTQPVRTRPTDRPLYLLADPALGQLPGALLSATIPGIDADSIFAGSPHSLEELQQLVAKGEALPEFPLGITVRANTAVKHLRHFEASNVIARLEGSDPLLKKEYVVVSAHLDHLGVGRAVNGDTIYNGAMDNASGVASVLEIARSLTHGPRPKRSVLFLVLTGEEEGLLGSKYFVGHPTAPRQQIVADINMDMFLPLFPLQYLEVQGLGESTLGNDIRGVAQLNDIEVQFDKQPDQNRFVRSDQANFISAGIPAIAFKFGWIPDSPEQKIFNDFVKMRYHQPSDDILHPIDKQAAADFDHVIHDLILRVANASKRPAWYPESFFAHQD